MIDAMMGSGKTQAMYQTIRNHPEKSYMIVTPYLKTIQDAKNEVNKLYEPEYKGGSKLDSLKYLLSHGYNIGCTHSLFLDVDSEIWDLIRAGGYTLFIDEALDVVKPVNDLIDNVSYHVKKGTASFLINQGIIQVDEYCRVTWCGKPTEADYEYTYLEPLIKTGNVLCVKGQLFLWIFPPQVFESFEDIYILSYLFQGSVFDAYLKINKFEYTLGSVSGSYGKDEGFIYTEYNDDAEYRKTLKSLIKIYDGKANQIGEKRCDLSSSWYEKATPSDISQIRKCFNTFYKRKKLDEQLMWTSFKDEREKLCIDGAKYIRKLTSAENDAMAADPEHKDSSLNKLRCFVSCNAKATNDFDDRQTLAYLINRFYNPLITGLFRDIYGIKLNENRFALSEMIQWIWRSRIRKANLPDKDRSINIYIPSSRMRGLMEKWLDGEDV